jgi:hypothetical protein
MADQWLLSMCYLVLNDSQHLTPMLDALGVMPEATGTAQNITADNGYYIAGSVNAATGRDLTPYLATSCRKYTPPVGTSAKRPWKRSVAL